MSLFQLFGYNLLVISAVLVLRVLVLVFRLPRPQIVLTSTQLELRP